MNALLAEEFSDSTAAKVLQAARGVCQGEERPVERLVHLVYFFRDGFPPGLRHWELSVGVEQNFNDFRHLCTCPQNLGEGIRPHGAGSVI